MQVKDPVPKELSLVDVVSRVVKVGIMNSENEENLVVLFTVSIIMKRNATVKLHFSKSFFCFCFKLPSYNLTRQRCLTNLGALPVTAQTNCIS